MIAGVTRRGPSHSTPPNGLANVEALIATVYEPLPHVGKPEAAVGGGWRLEATFEPPWVEQVEVHAGQPQLLGSTLPGFPPPGLKSRQTTPLMPPCSGSGVTACLRIGRDVGRAGSPSDRARPCRRPAPGS